MLFRSSALMASALRAAGAPVLERTLPALDHFSIYDAMGDPAAPVAHAARALAAGRDPGDISD